MKINQYEEFIMKQLHGKRDFLVSEQLSERLMASFKITNENARKIIQRTVQKGLLKSSSPLTFGKRSYAYYLPRNVLDVEAIKVISQEYRQPLYRLLCIMETQGGVISQYEAFKAVASPVNIDKTKVSHISEIIRHLVDLKIVEEYIEKESGCYYVFRSLENRCAAVTNHYSNMVLDCSIIPDLIYWLREHNLIDNKNAIYRNKSNPNIGALHNNLVWDAFAYTRTSGINTDYSKDDGDNKNILVVLDVIISRDYTAEDLHSFYDRIQIVRNSTFETTRKVFPIVVFRRASTDVMKELFALGFMKLNIGTVFGTKIYEVIDRLRDIKMNELLASDSDTTVSAIESILTTIHDAGQEGNLRNIKGDLFESLMYQLISMIYPGCSIRQNIKISDKNKDGKDEKYEYDLVVTSDNHNEIVIIELKGYKGTDVIRLADRNTPNSLRWFFRRTFPHAKSWFRKTPMYANYRIACSFITTAKFHEDDMTILQEINKSKNKPSQIDVYYSGEKLLALLDDVGLKHVKNIIGKYYSGA